MRTAYGYTRIEDVTDTHVGTGLGSQRKSIAAYCRRHRLRLVGFEEDIGGGISDAMSQRVGWARVIAALERRELDAVVVAALDHLDGNLMMQESQLTHVLLLGAEMHSVAEPQLGDDDPARAQFRRVRSALRVYETAFGDAQRVVALGQAVSGGSHRGIPEPYGYRAERVAGTVRVTVNEVEARVIRSLFEAFMRGHTERGLAHILTQSGVRARRGRKWTEGMVRSILTTPQYAGQTERHGMTIPLGQPIIAPGLFCAVKQEMADRRQRRQMLREAGEDG